MKTVTFIPLLFGVVLATPADAQTSPPVRTKSFIHEWVQTSLFSDDSSGPDTGPNIQGKMFLEDVSQHHSKVEIFLAQQATRDLTPILDWAQGNCRVPPESFTLNCPFQGQKAPVDPQHITFNHSGTYRAAVSPNQPTSYTLNGHRDDTFCNVEINGVRYFAIGFLTNIKDTRRGNVDNPVIFWEIPNTPNHWLNLAELVEVYRQIAPPAQ